MYYFLMLFANRDTTGISAKQKIVVNTPTIIAVHPPVNAAFTF
jgi:hypothetical protein